MQIVIDIPREKYDMVRNKTYCGIYDAVIYKAIANGIPLPKGHGKLKDIDAIIDTLDSSDRDIYVKECLEEDTPTIIPADTEREDE